MTGLISQCLIAFLVGGAVCTVAQLLIDLTSLTPPRILVLYVTLGVFLGAVGLYEPLYRFAGCGISVPLVGFGGAVARGVREAIHTDGLIGALTGGLGAAAGGTAAALVFGYLVALLFRATPKTLTREKWYISLFKWCAPPQEKR